MRALLWILSTVIFILAIVGILAYFNATFIASRMLSSSLGTKVTVGQVIFTHQEIRLEDIAVKDPRGGRRRDMLFIKTTSIQAPYKNYFHKEIVINKLHLSDVTISIDFLGSKEQESNWSDLQEKMEGDTLKVNEPIKRWALIHELLIEDIDVKISAGGLLEKEKHLSRIKLNDVRTKNGELGRQLVRTIIASLMFNLQNLIDLPVNITKDGVKEFFKPFEGLFKSQPQS